MASTDSHNGTFGRWRPRMHLIAPRGWLNDPCAPVYNASTGKYHLGFQWNPDGWDWGNIAWGAAISADLINWEVSETPSIAPSATEDKAGVFTGAVSPINLPRKGSRDHLTCFYTSAQGFNIHYSRPYERGSERLHAATSVDGGISWQRYLHNPILSGPPSHLSVTGWRDPYIFRWPRLDRTRGSAPGTNLYGIISGGIRNTSPTIFLYTINEADPTKWTFLSTLLEPGLNFSPTILGGDFGVNWEVANIITLEDQDRREFDILVVGVEGCKVEDETALAGPAPVPRAARSGRSQKWFCGVLQEPSGNKTARMEHNFSGILDWGVFYAANSFYDPVSNQRVVHGWILEEDLGDELREAQGWSGFISLPRSLSMQTIKHVDATCTDVLEKVPGFTYSTDENGIFEVSTICCQPHSQLQTLRRREPLSLNSMVALHSLDAMDAPRADLQIPGLPSWELDMSLSSDVDVQTFGIDIFHSPDHKSLTRILFEPAKSLITIDRSLSRDPDSTKSIRIHPEVAHHAFLSIRDKDTNNIRPENLDTKIFFDVSVLEIFVNSRTVITTRIYPESGKCYGISPFVVNEKDVESCARMDRFKVWELNATTPGQRVEKQ
ncbi:Arabinanase/levansucrase/invertase [Aureobasidium pullulans]|nr:Arabinanase/levansucrase/invertase [Aureobasidium pullulans]THZ93695.1 Arabinanase/levansucrase/invertase [Aureobasidium pullulans]TIA08149.1 Arabinanase/levansucrase/invertase [Aureobasidium pullulans]